MVLGYRAILRLEDDIDAIDAAEEQLHSWLRGKTQGRNPSLMSYDWDGTGAHQLGPDSTLRVYHIDDDRDQSRRRLFRLSEQSEHGVFTVSLYAASLPLANGNRQTLVVETSWQGETRDGAEANVADGIFKVSPPRLAKDILETYRVTEGATPLTGAPRVVSERRVDLVHRAILDPDRRVSVIVAAEPAADMREQWRKLIGNLTRESVGISAVFIVAQNAIDVFNNELPYGYHVKHGEVRTFQPGVDFSDESDSFRHRLLTLETLSQKVLEKRHPDEEPRVDWRFTKTHALDTRRRFIEQVLPKDIRRLIRLFGESEAEQARDETKNKIRDRMRTEVVSGQAPLRKLHDASLKAIAERHGSHVPTPKDGLSGWLAPQPTPQVEPAPVAPAVRKTGLANKLLTKVSSLFNRLFGVSEPTEADIDVLDDLLTDQTAQIEASEAQIKQQVAHISDLNERLEEQASISEDLRLDLRVLENEADETFELLKEARYNINKLNATLYATGRHDEVEFYHSDDRGWDVPGDFSELIGRLENSESAKTSLRYVVFTGDRSTAQALDEQANVYVDTVWRHVRALSDYCAAKADDFEGNFRAYLDSDDVPGKKISPKRFAAVESEQTREHPKYKNARIFKVPHDVDANGEVFMESHTKIATSDQISPRMHFYDDTTRTGKIYIGYIGRHLPNSKTS